MGLDKVSEPSFPQDTFTSDDEPWFVAWRRPRPAAEIMTLDTTPRPRSLARSVGGSINATLPIQSSSNLPALLGHPMPRREFPLLRLPSLGYSLHRIDMWRNCGHGDRTAGGQQRRNESHIALSVRRRGLIFFNVQCTAILAPCVQKGKFGATSACVTLNSGKFARRRDNLSSYCEFSLGSTAT